MIRIGFCIQTISVETPAPFATIYLKTTTLRMIAENISKKIFNFLMNLIKVNL